jgi:transposase
LDPGVQVTTYDFGFMDMNKKDTLLNICRNNYTEKKYAVDEIIEQAGHEVLRLPPYHCIFNAIEMVWSQANY